MLVPNPLGGTHHRWMQQVRVVRGDNLAYHLTDYGPEEDYEDVQPLVMPSFGDDTVAQLREFADKNREDRYWANRSREMMAESTLIEDHIRQIEQDRLTIKNRSVFGSGVVVERNGWPQNYAWSRIKEARNAQSNR